MPREWSLSIPSDEWIAQVACDPDRAIALHRLVDAGDLEAACELLDSWGVFYVRSGDAQA